MDMVRLTKRAKPNLSLSRFYHHSKRVGSHPKNKGVFSVSAMGHLKVAPKHEPGCQNRPYNILLLKYDLPSAVSHELGPKKYEKN